MTFSYFRPEWTCGRYNAQKNIALIYNLIEGVSYFFEDYSALIIKKILLTKRSQYICLDSVIQDLPFAEDEILDFVEELARYGLVAKKKPTENLIKEYRTRVVQSRIKDKSLNDSLLIGKDGNAEKAYSEACGENHINSVMFELTYRCSEMCIHCYNPGAVRNNSERSCRGDRVELSFDDYKCIIDELYDLGICKVCLSGGDPFSKDIVWNIIEYLYDKEIAFDIFTNGLGIVNKVERLAKYYPRLVGISLYSNLPEIHDSITTVSGSYEKTLSVIDQCAQLGIPMNLKCCIMQPNFKSYYTIKEIARKYGIVPQFDLNITDALDGDRCASHYLRLTSEI